MTTETVTTDITPPAKPSGRGVYTIPELAALLGVSERHIHRLKDQNALPGLLKLGGRIVFAKVQIDRWLAARSERPAERNRGVRHCRTPNVWSHQTKNRRLPPPVFWSSSTWVRGSPLRAL